jgi:hypothetical protein
LSTTPALIYGAATFPTDLRLHRGETEISWCAPRLPARAATAPQAIQATLEVPSAAKATMGATGCIGQCNGTCTESPQVWVNESRGQPDGSKASWLARDIKESRMNARLQSMITTRSARTDSAPRGAGR